MLNSGNLLAIFRFPCHKHISVYKYNKTIYTGGRKHLNTCKIFILYTSDTLIYFEFTQVMYFDIKLTITKKKYSVEYKQK